MISVITPVYNGERFIKSCIQGVIQQMCPDIEHILVDRGSGDQTVRIIQHYAEQYSHIRWISEPDRGSFDAINKGIALAKGDILTILNVEDSHEPNTLKQVRRLFPTLPEPALVVGNCNIWQQHHLLFVNKPKKLGFTDLLLGSNANPFPSHSSACFYHRSLHDRIGLYSLDEHYPANLDFLLRATQVATCQSVDITWGNDRQRNDRQRNDRQRTTQTHEDLQNAHRTQQVDRLLRHHRQSLPPLQRFAVTLSYQFYKTIDWQALQAFFPSPDRILPTLEKRFNPLLAPELHQKQQGDRGRA
ncbi:MAG: glycosyltransferase [Oculatellaceae cyanobacterium Prado106]|nr:glycosyltransferase [Oculatellaceae cyanobacterium Prado106]